MREGGSSYFLPVTKSEGKDPPVPCPGPPRGPPHRSAAHQRTSIHDQTEGSGRPFTERPACRGDTTPFFCFLLTSPVLYVKYMFAAPSAVHPPAGLTACAWRSRPATQSSSPRKSPHPRPRWPVSHQFCWLRASVAVSDPPPHCSIISLVTSFVTKNLLVMRW